MPDVIAVILGILAGICWLLYLPWLIFDVLYTGSSKLYILLGIFCYPIGLLIYLLSGRET